MRVIPETEKEEGIDKENADKKTDEDSSEGGEEETEESSDASNETIMGEETGIQETDSSEDSNETVMEETEGSSDASDKVTLEESAEHQDGETSEEGSDASKEESLEETAEAEKVKTSEDSAEITKEEETEGYAAEETGEDPLIEKGVTDKIESAEENTLGTIETADDNEVMWETETEPEIPEFDEIGFNTGSHVFRVVSRSAGEKGIGDDVFSDDGSYTINIPEPNPFFPYEVQFVYNGKTENRWFLTPDDSVDIHGHIFYVSAYFDSTAITQMSLNVAGDTVPVYPKKKTFTDDGGDAMELSLLPLEERELEVDLTGFTPVELTRVEVGSVFKGDRALKDGDMVMLAYGNSEYYKVSPNKGIIDLSRHTFDCQKTKWQIVVGDDDQLADQNIRYTLTVKVTESRNWLIPTVYMLDSQGKWKQDVTFPENTYYMDAFSDGRKLYIQHASDLRMYELYISLEINKSVFDSHHYDHIKVYAGRYTDPKEAVAKGEDITNKIFINKTEGQNGGYAPENIGFTAHYWITMISYNSEGEVTGCLPVIIQNRRNITLSINGMYAAPGIQSPNVSSQYHSLEIADNEEEEDNYDSWDYKTRVYTLDPGYSARGTYYLTLDYKIGNVSEPSSITAAYAGKYYTIKEARQAGAQDIKDLLFDQTQGYGADYSQGVYFTVFVGEDPVSGQTGQRRQVYKLGFRTEEYTPDFSDSSIVKFTGLKNGAGENVTHCIIDMNEDSYGENNYLTILVNKNTDLKLAPEFQIMQHGVKLYASGGTAQEISGKSIHDFSKGAVEYTAVAENGDNSKNYWIQVVRAADGKGELYINSLEDLHAKTRRNKDENTGVTVISSTREMFLDERHDYEHNILIANVGTDPIPDLKAELVSNEVELDSYWTLNGDYGLAGFNHMSDTINRTTHYGSLKNLAKLRLVPKKGTDDGRDISGTLTIKSGEQILMVLTLTGVVGDPGITTTEIPTAVKYVPYGTMIQNNNKYTWNKVRYELAGGELPDGMSLKSNGELYGIPKQNGEFKFTVSMTNSYGSMPSREKELTLTVQDNGNLNVYNASDAGYELMEPIGTEKGAGTRDYVLENASDQKFVSAGQFGEFIDLWLNGEKLIEGEDYTKESGSTRITVRRQTFVKKAKRGTNTLSAEFRVQGDRTKELKRTAQNFRMEAPKPDNNAAAGSHTTATGSKGSSGGASGSSVSLIRYDSKKGYVHAHTGIITGKDTRYSKWEQDEKGWKLEYADKTAACGHSITLEGGDTAEQILWEKINGSWYAFGVDGYLKNGWVFDYQLNGWYNVSADNGMRSSWYVDPQDQNTYYLEPLAGRMVTGWKAIDSKWYYFNTIAHTPTWQLNKDTGDWNYNTKSELKPFGAMYKGEKTPDDYYVNENGEWDGKER